MSLRISFSDYDWPIDGDYQPYSHQVDTTKFLLTNKRAYVLNGLGTGKTMSALWATDFLIRNDKIKRVLIICPLSTMGTVWKDSIRFGLKCSSYRVAYSNRRTDRIAAIKSDAQYVIINHDGIKIVLDEILEAKFDVIIIDELTAFKSRGSDRTKAMRKIANKAKAVWGLTGNPTPNKPTEAFAQAKVVNPHNPELPMFFTKFRDLVEYEVAPRIWAAKDGSENEVYKILAPAVRYKRDDCIDIPDLSFYTHKVEMTKNQLKVYDDIKKKLIHEYEEGEVTASNAGVKLLKLLQVAAGWVKNDVGETVELDSKPRLEALLEIYNELDVKKLVVFSNFRASVEGVAKYLRGKGINALHIHGDVEQNTRADYIRRFQMGDINVLVIQPKTASHGITLTASNTIVWHSLDWSGETYGQANGRISRIGQTRKQAIYNFVGCQAEAHVLRLLQDKDTRSTKLLEMFKEAIFTN